MSYPSVFWKILTSVVGWNQTIPTPPLEKENDKCDKQDKSDFSLTNEEENILLNNWEWMLSTAEEIAENQSQTRCVEMKKELETIKRANSSLKFRSYFVSELTTTFSNLPEENKLKLQESRLDASKRDKIIRDVVRKFQHEWKSSLVEYFSEEKLLGLLSQWEEEPYKKNICGELSSMGFHASHRAMSEGLNAVIVSDILWSMHLCLTRELGISLKRSLEPQDHQFLCSKILITGEFLFNLWYETSLHVGTVSDREGKLPIKWEQLRKIEEEKIIRIKQSGFLTRFNDGPLDPFQKNSIQKVPPTSFKEKQSMLKNTLFLNKK
jgi:hypothetical protein